MNLSTNDVKFKEKSGKKLATEKRDDFLSNRIMLLLIALTVIIVTLLLLRKNNNNFEAGFIIGPLLGFRIGTGVLFAAAAVNFIIKKNAKTDESFKYFNSAFLLGISVVLFVLMLAFPYVLTIGTVIGLIGALLLYFLYCFYQRDFFVYASLTCVGSLLIYFSSLGITAGTLKSIVKVAGKWLAVILPALFIIALLLLKKSDGSVVIGGKTVKLMRPGYNYYPFFVCSAITLAGSALTIIIGAAMIYAQIALFAAFIVIAIIYTIKMM